MKLEIAKQANTLNANRIELFKALSYRNNAKNILFIGVTHGEEPEGEPLIKKLINKLNNKEIKNNLFFIPCLNPDGRDLKTRGNANGVDINRNFPTKNWELTERNQYFGGEKPASEIETKFLMEVLDEIKPDIILTIHAPYEVVNFDGPAKEIAQKLSELCGYPVSENIGYPTPGSFGNYAGVEKNIATITLELPEDGCIDTLWQDNKNGFMMLVES